MYNTNLKNAKRISKQISNSSS